MYVVDIDGKLKAFWDLEDANSYIINYYVCFVEDRLDEDESREVYDYNVDENFDIVLYKVSTEVEMDISKLFEKALTSVKERKARS